LIDKQLAHKASQDDDDLLRIAHPIMYGFLKKVGNKYDAKRMGPLGVIVSEASLIRSVLLDSEHFSKVGKGASSDLWTPIIGDSGLVNMDGSEHAHLRKQLAPLFTAKFVSSIVDDSLRPHLETVKAKLLAGEAVDVAEVVESSAARIIANITGLTESEFNEEQLKEKIAKVRELTSFVKLTRKRMKPNEVAEARKRLDFLNQSVADVYARGGTNTVPGRLREAGLTEKDALSVISALIVTGTETILSFLPRMVALFIGSGHLSYVSENPEAASAALNESFRVIVPTPVMVRSVLKPTEINGINVKPGDRIVLSTVVACHREGDFDPFVPVPKDMRNLWFGAGAHFCIGMPLVMAQATLFIDMLTEVNNFAPLKIVSKKARTKTLAGSYKEMVIQCQTS
jgi:cytochrome P450